MISKKEDPGQQEISFELVMQYSDLPLMLSTLLDQ